MASSQETGQGKNPRADWPDWMLRNKAAVHIQVVPPEQLPTTLEEYAEQRRKAIEAIKQWPEYLLRPLLPRLKEIFPDGVIPPRTGEPTQSSTPREC